MNSIRVIVVGGLACFGAFALSGCGSGAVDNLPRQAVSGTVTLDGKPLEQGTITFTPQTDLPTPGMVSISGGSYSIPQTQGLVPGSYKVSILGRDSTEPVEKFGDLPGVAGRQQAEAADKKNRAALSGKAGAAATQPIPSQYNTATTLTAEVKDGGPNTFPFNLSSGPAPRK
jgi:hypothetical protein